MTRLSPLAAFLAVTLFTSIALAAIPKEVKSTQKPGEHPPTPQESLKKITVPEGFEVTLFAGEPDVAQPIAVAFDGRGRLWVAECYSYPDWKETGHDRILIFEDTDGDGTFDQRKVFADKLANLTGLELGFGGVWACCAPKLLFIPDADGDDRPDGKPVVKLDGWDTAGVVHNIYNGLIWGPDGWLYGCHGIKGDSVVGAPGTIEAERIRINCGIWRYHPTRKIVEAVAHGTTNPWGLDFDDHGEGFFTNCVIGHLWHLVPGAHYKRMYGQDFNLHSYGLIEATSDHIHWGGGKWTESRGGAGKHDKPGGGHAHTGAMIYLGDNWPDKYRNHLFTCNIHGYRINQDILVRHGSGYVGKHGKDFFHAGDVWFRGIALRQGPSGEVFVTDWSDLGECHDKDGVHRQSGRIYRISYGKLKPNNKMDLAGLDNAALVKLQLDKNDWKVRYARRLLQERAAEGKVAKTDHQALLAIYNENPEVTRKLRALWSLYATGGASQAWLQKQLDHPSDHVRSWAVRLLCDGQEPAGEVVAKFSEMAQADESALVRLYLASSLQRMPLASRWDVAQGLVSHAEDNDDLALPLMVWYGIEPAVPEDRARALALAAKCKLSTVRQFIAKRIAAASK